MPDTPLRNARKAQCSRYGEAMEITLTGVFEKKADDCWIAWVEELPGANTQGSSLEEAKRNLREAISMVLEASREIAEQELIGKDVIREELSFA